MARANARNDDEWDKRIAMARAQASNDEAPVRPVAKTAEPASPPRRRLARGTDSRNHSAARRVPLVRSHNSHKPASALPGVPRALRSRRPNAS